MNHRGRGQSHTASSSPTATTAETAKAAGHAHPGSGAANDSSQGTLGATAIHYFGENLKASVTYELPMTTTVEGVVDPHDNLLTVQFQARF